jgi:hypothetical protein
MGIVHKDFILQAKHSVLHTAVTFCGTCMKICEDITHNFDRKELAVASLQCTIFYWGVLGQKLASLLHHTHFTWPPVTFLYFPQLKILPF